ncbi:MAG: Permease of the drug/metabolite transporter (DMT) superfamily [uncultured Thiotrichaceae bacterium]|uniref:Permease of the drug/metabolite transporter (DMT) superfamily n=1 Tax=uncultured Thiotrichaceae bacterium TaxID=298394 RepID=A0A6S6SWJ8_9GAMM|nr:MAG: Permease of the drug/metabolite transporter (DMT) superfamily [uncultured Thiotrichaceae bacterium]
MPLRHQLLALLVAFIWGTNFVFIEIGLRELPPFLFACLRFILVAIPLVFILPRPNVPWWQLISYGVLIGFGQFGLLFWAIQDNITPGLASLVVQIQVFFTILLASFLFSETIRRPQWIALAISFSGLLLIALFTDGDTTLPGLGVVMIAAMSWAGGNLVVKRAGRINFIAFIAWSALFSIPPLALMSLYSEGWPAIQQGLTQAGWISWSVVLWQTIGNTLIGYGLWNMLLSQHKASEVTPWALMVPVFGMIASALALSEPMPWWKWVAAILIMAGLIINLKTSRIKKA